MFSWEAGAKWQAWEDVKGTSKEDAMNQYIEEADRQMSTFS